MTNTEIIYQALLSSGIEIPELELEEADGRCIACGKEITEGAKLKKVISSNFTDYDTFKCPEGTHICKECGMKNRKETGEMFEKATEGVKSVIVGRSENFH